MTENARRPALGGVAQCVQRCDDPRDAVTALGAVSGPIVQVMIDRARAEIADGRRNRTIELV